MKKIALVATAALMAAGSTLAFAQAPGGGPGAGPPFAGGRGAFERLTKDDFSSLVDAQVAAIRAGMKFTPEQERLFQPVEQMIRRVGAERAEMIEQRRTDMEQRRTQAQNLTPEQRREQRQQRRAEMPDIGEHLDRMGRRGEMMKAFSDAAKPLYASLDERQKRILPVLMRSAMAMGGGMGRGMMGGWRGGHHHHDRINWRGDRN